MTESSNNRGSALTLRIANAAGFWGDRLDAPRRLVDAAEVDYLTLEYLAELTMSILARQREKDPEKGYAGDFLTVLRSLLPALNDQPQLKIVTNAGGVNTVACARAASLLLVEAGMGAAPIGCVSGDDVSEWIDPNLFELTNLETDRPVSDVAANLVCAHAYLGARPIVDALEAGARIVISGRVADASLAVGPAVHHFGWQWGDWDRLAGASAAGHLIECGAQVTGGYSTDWKNVPDLADVGYPIAELEDDGSCVITKPPGTGGVVSRQTVVEQLVYEIGDPQHYLTPDVDVDFTTVQVAELGGNRVAVRGATGRPATDFYKVSLIHRDGAMAAAQLVVFGPDCVEKAKASADIILARGRAAGLRLDETHVELLGTGAAVPGVSTPSQGQQEVVLRIAVRGQDAPDFAKQIAPLITSGPAGLAGYAQGRPRVHDVLAHWPTLIEKDRVQPTSHVLTANEWVHRKDQQA